MRLRHYLLSALLILSTATPSLATRDKLQGWCEQGGVAVTIPGTQGSGSQRFNRSYPNATVSVFVSGTATLATIYSDFAGTAQANPFTADSTAFWSFYTDTVLVDVRCSSGGISAPFTFGALRTPNEWINVMDLGAKCDGSTDDTTAFQRAITLTGNGTMYIPPGNCIITAALTVPSSGTETMGLRAGSIIGAGRRASKITYNGTGHLFDVASNVNPVGGLYRDFSIDLESNANSSVGAFRFRGGTAATMFENIIVFIDGNSGNTFWITGVASQSRANNTFINVETYSNSGANSAGSAFLTDGSSTTSAFRFVGCRPEYALVGFDFLMQNVVLENPTFGVTTPTAGTIGVRVRGTGGADSGVVVVGGYFDASLDTYVDLTNTDATQLNLITIIDSVNIFTLSDITDGVATVPRATIISSSGNTTTAGRAYLRQLHTSSDIVGGTEIYFGPTTGIQAKNANSGPTSVAGSNTAISATMTKGGICNVNGVTGGDEFFDVVATSRNSATPTVVSDDTISGSPAARTYTTGSSRLQLAMAAGTYTVNTACVIQ